MIHFKENVEKIVNSLLFLIKKANEKGCKPSQYELVKAIFLADRAHLNKYGRPITFDNYSAMKYGPVPSLTYDCLKPSFNWARFEATTAPWASEAGEGCHLFSISTQGPNLKKMSKSDIKCLEDGLNTVLSLSFAQITRLTHEDPAYIEAWKDDEQRSSFPMNMCSLFDNPDSDAIDDLQYLAEMATA